MLYVFDVDRGSLWPRTPYLDVCELTEDYSKIIHTSCLAANQYSTIEYEAYENDIGPYRLEVTHFNPSYFDFCMSAFEPLDETFFNPTETLSNINGDGIGVFFIGNTVYKDFP